MKYKASKEMILKGELQVTLSLQAVTNTYFLTLKSMQYQVDKWRE